MDALEAVLAAIYLDGGLEAARRFVLRIIVNRSWTDRVEGSSAGDGLQVGLAGKVAGSGDRNQSYVLVKERGPEHSKTFTVEARCNLWTGRGKSEFVGRAEGSTKKNAEQDAARQVLEYLGYRAGRRTRPRRSGNERTIEAANAQ